jgi:hypothetical protein
MTNSQAILIGACVIAAAVFLGDIVRPASAQARGGPFQLMHHSNSTALAGVFRLDTASGEVSYCHITAEQNLTCSRTVQ